MELQRAKIHLLAYWCTVQWSAVMCALGGSSSGVHSVHSGAASAVRGAGVQQPALCLTVVVLTKRTLSVILNLLVSPCSLPLR